MKIHNLTMLFFLITFINSSIIKSQRNATPRSLENPENEEENPDTSNYTQNEIVYHVKQDILSRQIVLDKVFDGRDLDQKELDNSKKDFEYEKDEDGNYIYRENENTVNDITEIHKIDKMVNDIRGIVEKRIMKGAKNIPNEDKLQRSYAVYQDLENSREVFFIEKSGLLKKVSELKDLTLFALNYVENNPLEGIKNLVSQRDIELDEHNRLILIELLKKLDGFALEFWNKFYNDYSQAFDLIHGIIENEHMSDSEKIAKSIEVSIKISIFEVDTLQKLGDEILKVSQLILDNPKYDHLSSSFNKDMGFSDTANAKKVKKETEGKKSPLDPSASPLESSSVFNFTVFIGLIGILI